MSQDQNGCEWVSHHLPWYLNETLDDLSADRVASHLKGCQSCQRELEEVRWSLALFSQHLPIGVLEALVQDSELGEETQETAYAHLEGCESCSEQLELMKSSWRQLLATPAPDVKPPKRFAWGWVPACAAALMITALGLGWWSSYRALRALTDAGASVEMSAPQPNLVSKDLFPVEMARRTNADQLIYTFDGFKGLALTLHSQLPQSSQPFSLVIEAEDGDVLWRDDRVVGQDDGLVALFVPANFLGKGPLILTLSVPGTGLAEHYRLDAGANR